MTELDPAVRASIFEIAERYVRAYVDWDIYTNQCTRLLHYLQKEAE